MKIISKSVKMLTVFLLVLGITGCSDDDDGTPVVTTTTVVDVAVANGFTSLAAALTATDLVTTLQGAGPFTVFAPTNDAFDDLLDATGLDLENLTTDQEELVRKILLNHVIVGSELDAAAVTGSAPGYVNTGATGAGDANLSLFYNVNGSTVQINGGTSTTAGADVTMTDVQADNGVIHVIDKVLGLPTIADMAIANPALSTLVEALTFADTGTPTVPYITTTSDADAGPFTVFAPTNMAFTNVLAELTLTGFGEGMGELNAATTDSALLLHIVNGNIQSSALPNGAVTTLGGTITADNTAFTLTDPSDRVSNIVTDLVDIQTMNGVVHVIDTVLLPQL